MNGKGMHCVCVRSGRTLENPAFPDRAEPDRHRQALRAQMDTKQIQMMAPEVYR
jgi:hypothetical protein